MVKRTVWHDAKLTTLRNNKDFDIIHNGVMIVENDQIVWIGEECDFDQNAEKHSRWISAKGALITPGLIDCHTHCVYAGNRSDEWAKRLSGVSYEIIMAEGGGIHSTVMATREASYAELLHQSLARVQTMLQQGTTTIEIKSGYGLELEAEKKILKIAREISKRLPIDVKTTFLGAHVIPKEFGTNVEYIDYIIETMLPTLFEENLIDAVDAYCDSIAFNAKQLEKLFSFSKNNNLPIKIHCDQLSPTDGAELIARFAGLSADHLEYINENGVQALSKAGTVAVLLPGAHYFLNQVQIPPISLFRQYNVPMAIATDCNPGTSPTTSLLLMMNMACVQYKLTPIEAFYGVTVNAAKALGLQHLKGKLAETMQADFVLWDCDDPIELCYYFGSNPCLAVVKRGDIVYEKIPSL